MLLLRPERLRFLHPDARGGFPSGKAARVQVLQFRGADLPRAVRTSGQCPHKPSPVCQLRFCYRQQVQTPPSSRDQARKHRQLYVPRWPLFHHQDGVHGEPYKAPALLNICCAHDDTYLPRNIKNKRALPEKMRDFFCYLPLCRSISRYKRG